MYIYELYNSHDFSRILETLPHGKFSVDPDRPEGAGGTRDVG